MSFRDAYPTYVFGGRFQPFHLGHLEVVAYLAENSNSQIVLGIVNPDPTTPFPGDGRDWPRFAKEQNPLNYWERLTCISASLNDCRLSDRVQIVPLPRPSVNLKRTNQFIPPPPRSFVLCQRWGDEIETWKAQKLKDNGEEILWVPAEEVGPLARLCSAELVRSLIVLKNDLWEMFVTSSAAAYMKGAGIIDRIVTGGTLENAQRYVADLFENEARAELIADFLPENYASEITVRASKETPVAVSASLEALRQVAALIQKANPSTNISIDLHWGDRYIATKVGAQGPGSHSYDFAWHEMAPTVDLPALHKELLRLGSELRAVASTNEQSSTVDAVADAAEKAKRGDGEGLLRALKQAGKWAFDCSTEIGTNLAAEVIKKAMGL